MNEFGERIFVCGWTDREREGGVRERNWKDKFCIFCVNVSGSYFASLRSLEHEEAKEKEEQNRKASQIYFTLTNTEERWIVIENDD